MDFVPPGTWSITDTDIGYKITAEGGMVIAWVHYEEGAALEEIRGALSQREASMTAKWIVSLPGRMRPHSDPPARRSPLFVRPFGVGRSARTFKVEDVRFRRICSVPFREPARPGFLTAEQADSFAWWICRAPQYYEAHRILDAARFVDGWPGY